MSEKIGDIVMRQKIEGLAKSVNEHELWNRLFETLNIKFKQFSRCYLFKCSCNSISNSIMLETQPITRASCTSCGHFRKNDSFIHLIQHLTSLSMDKVITAIESLIEKHLEAKPAELSDKRKAEYGIVECKPATKFVASKDGECKRKQVKAKK